MKVSDVEFEHLRVGDRVKSDLTGEYGLIIEKITCPVNVSPYPEDDNWLKTRWGDERLSYQPHFFYHHVTYIG